MAQFPAEILPWIEMRFLLEDGVPNSLGHIQTFVANSTTPLETYSDVDLTSANPTTIDLDAAGRPDPIYLAPTGYKFIVTDVNDVEQYTFDNITNLASYFATQFGIIQTQGSQNVTNGFTQLSTDRFVTVDSSAGSVVFNLLPAADFTQELVVKNLGANTVVLTPDGTDTLEGLNTTYTLPAASSPTLPTVTLSSDGVSSVWIRSSHGVI